MAKNARVEIRASETEKAAWADAAGGARRVSEWLRALANTHALPENDLTGPVEALDAAGLELGAKRERVSIGKNGPQPRCLRFMHHRPGTYCASCKKIQ